MDRAITFYFPSKEMWDDWRQAAKECNISLSKYIFEMAERGRRSGDELVRPDLIRENSDLKIRNRKLEDDADILKTALENAQTEIYKLRFRDFESVDADGSQEYDIGLVKLLKRGRVLDSQEILAGLGIDPRDSKAVKLVSNQLEELRRFELIKETPTGWRWL